MRKSEYRVDIICPFDFCQLSIERNKMGSMCLHCDYSELKNENATIPIVIDEDSKEVKDYEKKYSERYEEV